MLIRKTEQKELSGKVKLQIIGESDSGARLKITAIKYFPNTPEARGWYRDNKDSLRAAMVNVENVCRK